MDFTDLPNIDAVHIKYPRSKKQAISADFVANFKKNLSLNIFLTIITLGLFCYQMRKKSKSRIVQAIIARKIEYIIVLIECIKKERQEIYFSDPRQAINAIFMKVAPKMIENDDKNIEIRAIYTPAEILLFITNPIRNLRQIKLRRYSKKKTDYIHLWQDIKKKSKVNQFRQTHTINFYTKYIKEEFLLSSVGIHDRILRSSVCKKSPTHLTMFKELSLALLELVVAYEDFAEFKHSNKDLYNLIHQLSTTSELDVKKLQSYMETGSIDDNLSPENRKQLIQLGNKQRALYSINESDVLDMCALILNSYQWEFLLSLQKSSDVSLNLINWAYEQTPNVINPVSFSEKLLGSSLETLSSEKETFTDFFKIDTDVNIDNMLILFAKEEGRAWPEIDLVLDNQPFFRTNEMVGVDKSNLIEAFKALSSLSDGDLHLLFLLQKALTSEGKACFEQAVEEGILKLLGEKCEFFIPILANTKIIIFKHDKTFFTLNYFFDQVIYKQGEESHISSKQEFLQIKQDIHFINEAWESNPPQVCLKGREDS